MGRKLLVIGCFILLCLMFSINTISFENGPYLSYMSISIPKNDVTYDNQHISMPFMDIQHAYIIVNGLNMTLKLKMGATAVLNSSTAYDFYVNLYCTNSYYQWVSIGAVTELGLNSSTELLKEHINPTSPSNYTATYHKTTPHASGRYIYWFVDLTELYTVCPNNQFFIKYNIFRQIQAKYEIHPTIWGDSYFLFHNGFANDRFSIDNTVAPSHSIYFWPSIYVGIGLVAIALFIIYKKIKKKRLMKQNELYPEKPKMYWPKFKP